MNPDDQYIDQITTEYAKKITRYTVQLYEHSESKSRFKSSYQPIASAVILTYNNKYYLVTAGHVINNQNKNNIGIFEKSTFYIIGYKGQKILNVNPEYSPENRNFDITIWQLDDNTIDLMKCFYSFLTFDKLHLKDDFSEETFYLIVGFPWRRTRFSFQKQAIQPMAYKFLTKTVPETIYQKLGLDSKENFIVEYNQRKIKYMKTGLIGRSIQLEGLSGCGIWYIPKIILGANETLKFYLSSIVFKHDDFKKYIISLKTKIIIQIMDEYF